MPASESGTFSSAGQERADIQFSKGSLMYIFIWRVS